MTAWIGAWLQAFGLTLLIELAIATPLLRVSPWWRRATVVAIANLATHPVVWFVIPGAALEYPIRIAVSEVWAVVLETLTYRVVWPNLRWTHALVVSACANVASFIAGIVLRWLHFIP